MQRSLQIRLLLLFATIAIVPLLAIGSLLTWQSYANERQSAFDLQREITIRAASNITDFLASIEREVRLGIDVSEFQTSSPAQQRTILLKLVSYRGSFDEISLLAANGQEQIRVSRVKLFSDQDLRDLAQTPEFQSPIQTRQTYYSSVQFNPESGEPSMLMSLLVERVADNTIRGVVISNIRLKPIWDLVADINVGDTGLIYILDSSGRLVAHRDPSMVLSDMHFTPPAQDGIAPGLTGVESLLTTRKITIGAQELTVVAELPADEALAPARRSLILTSILFLITLVIAAMVGFISVRGIVRPIRRLAAAAQAINAGDLSQRADIEQQDEIGDLARAFNAMTSQLRQMLESLEQRVAQRTEDLATRNADLAAALETLQQQQSQLTIAERTVRDLGTPVIPVMPGVTLVPLVGHITEDRAQQFLEVTLNAVAAHRTNVLLVDISGVALADTAIIHSIVQAAYAVRLLGARMTLVGMRPELAQGIVALDASLQSIDAEPTLAVAIERLQLRKHRKA